MESYMQWVMGMELTKMEEELCRDFNLSAGRSMGLTNDLYSWNVERHDRADRQWNAVPVIMKQYDLEERDAVVFLKGLVIQHEQETRRLGAKLQRYCQNSPKLQKYVEGMELMLGGNSFWSSSCPRYNPENEDAESDSSSSGDFVMSEDYPESDSASSPENSC
jgi:hypothetical protein